MPIKDTAGSPDAESSKKLTPWGEWLEMARAKANLKLVDITSKLTNSKDATAFYRMRVGERGLSFDTVKEVGRIVGDLEGSLRSAGMWLDDFRYPTNGELIEFDNGAFYFRPPGVAPDSTVEAMLNGLKKPRQ